MGLTVEQRNLLQDLLIEYRNAIRNRPRGGRDTKFFQADEVYIALTPAGGIPALTPLGTGTGAKPGGDFDVAGTAECDIYKIFNKWNNIDRIVNLSKKVYNLSIDDVPGDTYITVIKDKSGHWIAQTGGGPAGSNVEWIKCTGTTADSNGFYPGTLSTPETTGWNDGSTAVTFLPLNPQGTPVVTPVSGQRYAAVIIGDPTTSTKYALIGPIVKCDGSGNLLVG
jgi:hypothetical protein